MIFLALDIETVPQVRYTLASIDELDPLLDPDWLYETIPKLDVVTEVRAGRGVLAATGAMPALHPTTGHLVSIAWGWKGGDLGAMCHEVQHLGKWGIEGTGDIEKYERQLLYETLDRIAKARRKRTRLVTFGGKRFDLPFIMRRALLLGMKAPAGLDWAELRYPYGERDHCDLRMWLGNYERYAKGTQSHWAAAMGLSGEDHGAEVWEWVRAGEWAKLEEYGKQEMETLCGMYLKAEAWL